MLINPSLTDVIIARAPCGCCVAAANEQLADSAGELERDGLRVSTVTLEYFMSVVANEFGFMNWPHGQGEVAKEPEIQAQSEYQPSLF